MRFNIFNPQTAKRIEKRVWLFLMFMLVYFTCFAQGSLPEEQIGECRSEVESSILQHPGYISHRCIDQGCTVLTVEEKGIYTFQTFLFEEGKVVMIESSAAASSDLGAEVLSKRFTQIAKELTTTRGERGVAYYLEGEEGMLQAYSSQGLPSISMTYQLSRQGVAELHIIIAKQN